MALSKEEIAELKTQLRDQVKDLPSDKRESALAQIESMSDKAIELMLKQQTGSTNEQPIMRMLIEGKIPSVKIEENSEALAVLDNKPISKGHILIIPKEAVKKPSEISKSIFELAQRISKKIMDFLKAKEVKAETEIKFGKAVLNLIPIYDKPLDLKSPREESSPEELQKIKIVLDTIKIEKPSPEIIKVKKPRQKKVKLSKRIP